MVRDAKERASFVNDVNDKAIVKWAQQGRQADGLRHHGPS